MPVGRDESYIMCGSPIEAISPHISCACGVSNGTVGGVFVALNTLFAVTAGHCVKQASYDNTVLNILAESNQPISGASTSNEAFSDSTELHQASSDSNEAICDSNEAISANTELRQAVSANTELDQAIPGSNEAIPDSIEAISDSNEAISDSIEAISDSAEFNVNEPIADAFIVINES